VWSGQAHDAAAAMFGRATSQTSQFASGTDAVAAALNKGDSTIGAARHWLLRKADEIDEGELHVNDQWVVLIKPARVSEEKAAQLEQEAEKEQAEINRLLLALGDADDSTAANLQAAAKTLGFQPPDPKSPFYGQKPGELPPGDEVPNPRFPMGLMQQGIFRNQDMATTVRNSHDYTDADGHPHKTLTMMDGSRHEISEWGTYDPTVDDIYYDKNGKLISDTLSQQQYDGVKLTEIKYGDGTTLTVTQTPDGKKTGGVTTANGRHGVLPDEFFTHPAVTTVGGALTGLEVQAGSGGIPMLTAGSVKNLESASHYAGPAVGYATALYDVVTAKTFQDACVAAWSGGAGVVGGDITGAAFADLFAETGPGAAVAAMGGNMLGTWTFGYLGGVVGNIVCR
jgi:hypothetical protein